jgi:hypothetical protein
MLGFFLGKYRYDNQVIEEEESLQVEHLNNTASNIIVLISFIAFIVISCIAAYISWQCNVQETKSVKLLLSYHSFLFGIFYFVWYILYYKIFGNKCGRLN